MKPILVAKDFEEAAEFLGCHVAAIKAVAKVESSGDGFLANDEPKILFERHIFSKLTGRKFDATHPGISNSKPGGYGTVLQQHGRLQAAVSLDRNAALKSASWGKFQIMGMNFQLAGFKSLQPFVTAMYNSEAHHLQAFCNFVKSLKLDVKLRNRDWAGFAKGYNGVGYSVNKYNEKLAAAYKKYLIE